MVINHGRSSVYSPKLYRQRKRSGKILKTTTVLKLGGCARFGRVRPQAKLGVGDKKDGYIIVLIPLFSWSSFFNIVYFTVTFC